MAGDTRSCDARMRAKERDRKIWELRLHCVSFPDIARQLGMSLSGVYRAWRRICRELPESPTRLLRREQVDRLERLVFLLLGKMRAATEPRAIAALSGPVNSAFHQLAKLLGLYTSHARGVSEEAAEFERLKARLYQEQEDRLALVRAMEPQERTAYRAILEKAEARRKAKRAV